MTRVKKSLARWLAFLTVGLLLLSLAGCGGSSGGGSYRSEGAYDSGYAYDYDYDDNNAMEEAVWGYSGGDYTASNSAQRLAAPADAPESPAPDTASDPTLPRKLIRRASLTMETTTFDESAAALSDLVDNLGGYFSDASQGDQGGSRKRANYTIRIPANRFNDFLDAVGDICHETWRDVTQDDISEMYYDTQGRLRTQDTKLKRLQELLTQAENMEDIITIQSAISETEERIEELRGTLNHWDNQVDYATVSLTLSEVYRLSNNPPVPETFATRLGSAFTSGISDFFEWLGDLLISLAYSWLWWLLLIGVILGVLRIRWTAWWQKKREEKAARKAARQAARQKVQQSFPYSGGPFGQKNETPSGGEKQETDGKQD
ncbi:MAG: DUF4349 domain-containing protein [Oscillibacter sp.]|nr:DUF4349 domain-containing protein [Oscillibacter sp.]